MKRHLVKVVPKFNIGNNKLYTCNICQQSFSVRSHLSQHKKSAVHLQKKKNKNSDSYNVNSCGEINYSVNIKEENSEEESVDDSEGIFIKAEDIKVELKYEKSLDD